jgi:ubiquinone/menaquinone biosynthesis C-methylase UbiE
MFFQPAPGGGILAEEMQSQEDPRTRAATTYNAASDHYDDPANSFWEHFGRRTVERLDLNPGSRVLDVCCGSGASAIPAAEIVGPEGFVLGVDLAENLLELAIAKASHRGLSNIEFRRGDMLDLSSIEHTESRLGDRLHPGTASLSKSLKGRAFGQGRRGRFCA